MKHTPPPYSELSESFANCTRLIREAKQGINHPGTSPQVKDKLKKALVFLQTDRMILADGLDFWAELLPDSLLDEIKTTLKPS